LVASLLLEQPAKRPTDAMAATASATAFFI
jgi:hypothetical protein